MKFEIDDIRKKVLIWCIPKKMNIALQQQGFGVGNKQSLRIKFKSLESFLDASFKAAQSLGEESPQEVKNAEDEANERLFKCS